ncbi:MAG TPA: DHA2 family efflux MFS transporter permease subunit [Actinospica sp.]|nr:DHA2 family efflux MFS transporter permease subunit [Actinospica sp.]
MTAPQRWTLALASMASLMVGLDALVVTTALNTIRLSLNASMEDLEWTVNAYTLVFAALLLTAAALGDRIGRRRLLLLGLTVFSAASAACALAPGVGPLIAARALQGLGAAMIMPAALALVGAAFPPERRGLAMGVFGGVTGLAVLGGPVLGGAVVQGAAWEWIFWLNVPIGAVLIPFAARRITESTGPRQLFDLPGLLTSAIGVLGVVWALVHANSAGWSDTSTLVGLIGGLALLVVFAVVETRVAAPMLPLRLFRHRAFTAANAAGLLMTAAIFGAAFYFAQDLQVGRGLSPLAAGVHLLPWTATLFLFAPLAGAQINRFGERRLIVVGLLAEAAGFGWIAVIAHAGYPATIAPMALAGFGISIAMPAAQNAVLSAVRPQEIGKASGAYNALRQLGGALGIAVLSTVFSARGSYTTPQAVTDGFSAAMLAACALAALGALAGLGVVHRTPTARPAASAAPSMTSSGADVREVAR